MVILKQFQDLKFCRIKKYSKKPFEKAWTTKPYSYDDIQKFIPDENYGVLCGYNDLAVIDCDDKTFYENIKLLLPPTFEVQTGGGGVHMYYFVKDLKQKVILNSKIDGKHLGEVQSFKTQVVAPGSIHPNKKGYDIVNNTDIVTINCEQLFDVLKAFMKETTKTEEIAQTELKEHSQIDDLRVTDIFGTAGLKKQGNEYYGSHPIHGSGGGMNFWINPNKNTWHCFRCNSGGGALSAIAVKENIIDCEDSHRGNLRGIKAYDTIKIAEEKYGLQKRKQTLRECALAFKIEGEIKPQDFEIIWESKLKDYELEEKDWILDKLIPSKAICILTGKRGTLKTFLTLSMCYSIASGNKFLDTFETAKGKVIYLDKENGIGIMKKRTAMLRKGLGLNGEKFDIGFICFSQIKLDKLGGISAIEKVIEEHKPKLLVVDTYRRSVGFDENDAGQVSELFVDTLRPIVEKNNVSIVLIHHNRKSSQGEVNDEMDELRGSSDLANYADIILKLERKTNKLIVKQLKNRNAQELEPFSVNVNFSEDSDCVTMKYGGDYVKNTEPEKCVEDIIIWISEKEITTFDTGDIRKLAHQKNYKKNTYHSALMLLQENGNIESIKRGVYNVKNV